MVEHVYVTANKSVMRVKIGNEEEAYRHLKLTLKNWGIWYKIYKEWEEDGYHYLLVLN